MEEPSVLDYLKAKLMPWHGPAPDIPKKGSDGEADGVIQAKLETAPTGVVQTKEEQEPQISAVSKTGERESSRATSWPWRSLTGMALALAAQISLEPGPGRTWLIGAVLYILAIIFLIWASLRSELRLASLPENGTREDPLTVRTNALLLAGLLAVIAFLALGGNQFTWLNLSLWLLAIVLFIWGIWLPSDPEQSLVQRFRKFATKDKWSFAISRWSIVILGATLLVVFFRAYRLVSVPPEMVSDQAEKLLDIWDVLQGETRIFFPRNTGREGLQMYMTAAIIKLFDTGYSYLSLKIGTVLAGLLTLPFIYLVGKEVANRRVGLLALVFAGIAYWPNVISRVGLRFPLYSLFVAPALYYLLRGLRTRSRNDFILSGVFLGIGLHGYTPVRILPFVIVVAVGLYLLHRQSKGARKQALMWLAVLALTSVFIFLPLLRYSLENPEIFAFRSFSRLGTVERELQGPAIVVFISNLWKAITMFAWDDGQIWVTSVTNRPALDVVSGALFYAGVVLIFIRYVRERNWVDLFLLLSVPMLMLPSILSLAFPAENPSLNRMAGAIVPVFVIVALALDAFIQSIQSNIKTRRGMWLAWAMALVLIAFSASQNYDLVFNQYQSVFKLSSWNTTEMGQVIQDFSDSVGAADTAWVVAFPHWVDTRLVGINAGYPQRDYAIWPDHIADTAADPRAKLFLVKPDDEGGLATLKEVYPQGVLQTYDSAVENHDFYMFFVPPLPGT